MLRWKHGPLRRVETAVKVRVLGGPGSSGLLSGWAAEVKGKPTCGWGVLQEHSGQGPTPADAVADLVARCAMYDLVELIPL